jgi:hypothetical protein
MIKLFITVLRLELSEKNTAGWFILPTVITGLPDQSRYCTVDQPWQVKELQTSSGTV